MTAQSRAASRSLATVTDAPVTPKPQVPERIVKKEDGQKVAIHTTILLNRNPILTRTPTAFEKAYYAYQAKIERALHNPLPYDFYFKPGTQLELQFDKEEEERERLAFGKSATPSPRVKTEEELRATDEDNADALAALESQQQEDSVKLLPREHESDRTGDVKSLNRQGQRNVYLLVQAKDEAGKKSWMFPHAPVNTRENLFENVQNHLRSPFGIGMDTWVASKKPIGVHRTSSAAKTKENDAFFFYKAHILAGQVRPDGKNVLDFAWLTKEEIKIRVDQSYWDSVKDMISDF
ncbi:60S ribosomal protein L17 [Irpex rosettiformis]|uniref:60S ribosomal protein L17 n=1 Tax=Irpex rosettiformis TaxID=378272 RepID=A0ACB8TU76_9APHY|nr:60S ribosomal protein L17 [Irpex rosettiformis]